MTSDWLYGCCSPMCSLLWGLHLLIHKIHLGLYLACIQCPIYCSYLGSQCFPLKKKCLPSVFPSPPSSLWRGFHLDLNFKQESSVQLPGLCISSLPTWPALPQTFAELPPSQSSGLCLIVTVIGKASLTAP